jgi:Cu2+-containing amine oxidase
MISKLEHPLEMLSTEEISLAYEIYKTSEDYDEATHFSQISLVEPTKELLKDSLI